MFTVELYAGIRRAVMVDGLSRREAAKRFGVHRNTITKMLQYSAPPGYRRRGRPASKKLGLYMAWIDKVLEDDRSVHKKQRHTAQRIFERLRDEEGFSGGYTIVREYVARAMLRSREMFVPLSHRPGHAQADFGQADAYIAGKRVRFHYFCVDLPHSDGCFVKAYPAETAEAFCDGHVAAFDFFGGVPRSILSSNTRLRWPGSSRQMEKRTCGVRARKCSPNSRDTMGHSVRAWHARRRSSTDGASHAKAKRSQPIPHRFRTK